MRWLVLAPAGALWPAYFLGLQRGWWGSGVGDGWTYGLAASTAAAVGGAALGVLAGSLARRARRSPGAG